MDLADHYRALNALAKEALEALASDEERLSEFTSTHNAIADLERIVGFTSNKLEYSIFLMAIREFNYALYAASSASYRHAHSSLRLSIELFLSAIYFSGNEIKLRYWLSGKEYSNIVWSQISHEEHGVLSTFFIKPFFPDLSEFGKQYLALLNKIYRECSEFVHGNVDTHYPPTQRLEYDPARMHQWNDRAQAACLGMLFCFIFRYSLTLDEQQISSLEATALENFGHIQPVRAIFEKEATDV